jgi:hypothetical protein
MKVISGIMFIIFSSVAHAECTDKLAVQYVQDFYRDHYYFYADPKPQKVNQLYTPEFGRVIINHAECIGDNGICNLDFDPWLNAQDGYVDGEINYSIRVIDKGLMSVDLQYQFRIHPSHPASQQAVSLILNKVEGPLCWKLDDMLISGGTSMKKIMIEDYLHFYYYKRTKLDWSLISSEFDSSKIEVNRNGITIAEYEIDCDVSESIDPDLEQLDGEMNKVGLVVTPSQPKGLLITSCRVGAHSKRLSVYDLESKAKEPVWEKTGSYFAEWSINANYELVLSYDRPCNKTNCVAPFARENVVLGDFK